MIQRILHSWHCLACLLWAPGNNVFLRIMAIRSASAFLFSSTHTPCSSITPYIAYSILLSGIYIFALKAGRQIRAAKLLLYPDPRKRAELSLVVGEVHHPASEWPRKHRAGWSSRNEAFSRA
jgi:hypothetical protein